MSEWDAAAYHRVSDPLVAMGIAVLDRLPLNGGETVIDAGCGTGRLTARLLARLAEGRVIAVDRSARMLQLARDHVETHAPGRTVYIRADLAYLPLDSAADAIFSTAAFHWIHDHPRLFDCLHAALRPGGRLVAQCGGAGNIERFHRRVKQLIARPPFVEHFSGWTDPWEYADAVTTAERLRRAGFVEVDTALVDAPTTFDNPQAYAEYVSPIVLRTFLDRLPTGELRRQLVGALTELATGDDPPFCLDYRRLNISARRA